MTVQTMTPEEVRRHDKRGERDRRCNDCSTPITQYSRSGLCGPCVLRQRAAERVCERCGKGCQPGKTLCARWEVHVFWNDDQDWAKLLEVAKR